MESKLLWLKKGLKMPSPPSSGSSHYDISVQPINSLKIITILVP